jgi:hypothetical protein
MYVAVIASVEYKVYERCLRLTAEMADQAARRDVKPIFAKKLHILAALGKL